MHKIKQVILHFVPFVMLVMVGTCSQKTTGPTWVELPPFDGTTFITMDAPPSFEPPPSPPH